MPVFFENQDDGGGKLIPFGNQPGISIFFNYLANKVYFMDLSELL